MENLEALSGKLNENVKDFRRSNIAERISVVEGLIGRLEERKGAESNESLKRALEVQIAAKESELERLRKELEELEEDGAGRA